MRKKLVHGLCSTLFFYSTFANAQTSNFEDYQKILNQEKNDKTDSRSYLAKAILGHYTEQDLENRIADIESSGLPTLSDKEMRAVLNRVLMKKMHQHNVFKNMDELLYLHFQNYLREQKSGASAAPVWSLAEIKDRELGRYQFSDHMKNLKQLLQSGKVPDKEDMALNFVPTSNNRIDVLSDKEQFWPQLMKDLALAKDHIHINVFGFMGDEWGREVMELLAKKVQEGVTVRIMADALGARMHWYFGHKNEEFINELRSHGIEVVLSRDEGTGGNFHFDHRKFYIIDGTLAYNTGYTIEEHMRKIHFDMGMRIQGDMVKQLQSHYLISYIYFGGNLQVGADTGSFMKRYYPVVSARADEGNGTVTAKLLENIPEVQHRVTESYYQQIRSAKKSVVVINEFLSEPQFLEVVKGAAERGLEVELIYPRESEWAIHRLTAHNFFEHFREMKNVRVYLYDGPQNTGWLHTKGIMVDQNYVNFGSTNMDAPSLFHNYELNIETQDPQVVKDVQEKILNYAKKYSTPYQYKQGNLERLRSWGGGIISKFPQGLGVL